jgi:hypothetical protein
MCVNARKHARNKGSRRFKSAPLRQRVAGLCLFGNHRKDAASTRDARRQPRESSPSRSPLNQTVGQFYFEDWSEPLKLDS